MLFIQRELHEREDLFQLLLCVSLLSHQTGWRTWGYGMKRSFFGKRRFWFILSPNVKKDGGRNQVQSWAYLLTRFILKWIKECLFIIVFFVMKYLIPPWLMTEKWLIKMVTRTRNVLFFFPLHFYCLLIRSVLLHWWKTQYFQLTLFWVLLERLSWF